MWFLAYTVQLFDLILYLSIFVEILLAVIACINIIRGLKHKDELTYLPFGPALFIGGAIIIFFGDKIYDLLKNISDQILPEHLEMRFYESTLASITILNKLKINVYENPL